MCTCAVEGRECAGVVCCRGCTCTVRGCMRGMGAIWGWYMCQHALQGGCAPHGTCCRHQGSHGLTGPGPQGPASLMARSPGSWEHQHPPRTHLFHPVKASHVFSPDRCTRDSQDSGLPWTHHPCHQSKALSGCQLPGRSDLSTKGVPQAQLLALQAHLVSDLEGRCLYSTVCTGHIWILGPA